MEQSCTRRDSGSPLSIVGCHTLHRASSLPTHLGLSNHPARVGTAARPCPRLPVPHPSSSFLPPNTPWFEQPSCTRRDSGSPLSAPSGTAPFIELPPSQHQLVLQ